MTTLNYPTISTGITTTSDQPWVSVIIVNFNGRDHLESCLNSLISTAGTEIIVVDNASTDGSIGLIRERFPGVLLLRNRRLYNSVRGSQFERYSSSVISLCSRRILFIFASSSSELKGFEIKSLAPALITSI